eukprot:Nitzschia sp. Nitz4//scaffold65_size103378//8279//9180//NITZ4_004453-RA/size103378-augustus-gene-0.85-mRNA-1//-1//CDS//3329556201//9386//frame0
MRIPNVFTAATTTLATLRLFCTAATPTFLSSVSTAIPPPSTIMSQPAAPERGAFIVMEGVDRCGKTTQVKLLVERLQSQGKSAVVMRFPDRSTLVGGLIDQYLQSKSQLDDRAIHLLFSANRWEAAPTLEQHLAEGTTVVCDRYAYSGVAFSSAKESLSSPQDLRWCQACDVGLPAPDAVLFLDLEQDQAEQRGGYGQERYEKREFQGRVRERFQDLRQDDEQNGQVGWHMVDASQTIEAVQKDINGIVESTLQTIQQEKKQLGRLWTTLQK